MKLTDLNRERCIGANAYLAEFGALRVLIDAGLHPKKLGYAATPDYDRIPDGSLDLIVITHSHLDHAGSLPVILRRHPQAIVLCSMPTRVLVPRMLRNSCNVMGKQKMEYHIPEYPLYTFAEIDELEHRLKALPFRQNQTFTAHGESIALTLYPAGHVAGACGIKIVHNKERIFFTGDVLFAAQRNLPGAAFPEEPFDIVVAETTRGCTERPPENSREREHKRLIETIDHTLSRGGSVLIPSFALGRMQEMFSLIYEHQLAGTLPRCNVFSTGLGMDLVNYFDTISRKTKWLNFSRHIIQKLRVKPLKHRLQAGVDVAQKGIYVLSSGMLVPRTPSYSVAASLLDFKHNSLCFVGYCDPETPGGQLLATAQDGSFLFEQLDYVARVRAHIEKFDLSGHADREEILKFTLDREPRTIVLSHGDPPARAWFEDAFLEESTKTKVVDPEPGIAYEL